MFILFLYVKVISKNSLSKTGRDNLVTEIGLLKKIKHKFIVDLLDFHWDDKYIYIGMCIYIDKACLNQEPSLLARLVGEETQARVKSFYQSLCCCL